MATLIVGVGTTAVVQLMGKGTAANDAAAEMTTAVNLGNCVHELTQGMAGFTDSANHWGLSGALTKFNVPYVVGLDGQSFNPPVNASRQTLTAANYASWTQAISVKSVDSDNVKFLEPSNNPTTWPMARVTVTVSHGTRPVCTQSWLMVRTQ